MKLEDPESKASFTTKTEERFQDHLNQTESGEAEETAESLWVFYINVMSETAAHTVSYSWKMQNATQSETRD